MTFHDWTLFATFWALFVTSPGPNAVNCISNGMQVGFRRALWGVVAILLQASIFLTLAALGIGTLLVAAPTAFSAIQILGATVLITLGVRNWRSAAHPPPVLHPSGRSLFTKAFVIATVNAKSVMGYIAAFSQFVAIDTPLGAQLGIIAPTALTLTTLSYTGYCALGAGLGKRALGLVLNIWLRRTLAACFILYGALLAWSALEFWL